MPNRNRIRRKSTGSRTVGERRVHSRHATSPPPSPVHESVRILGIPASNTSTLIRQARKGFPFETVECPQHAYALSTNEIVTLVQIPTRTMTRRKESGRLQADESDRVLRAARTWMTTPQRGLGGAVPLELASTDIGAGKSRTPSAASKTESSPDADGVADHHHP